VNGTSSSFDWMKPRRLSGVTRIITLGDGKNNYAVVFDGIEQRPHSR